MKSNLQRRSLENAMCACCESITNDTLQCQQDTPAICRDPKRVGGKFPAWLDPSSIQDYLGDWFPLTHWWYLGHCWANTRFLWGKVCRKKHLMGYLLDKCLACCESLSWSIQLSCSWAWLLIKRSVFSLCHEYCVGQLSSILVYPTALQIHHNNFVWTYKGMQGYKGNLAQPLQFHVFSDTIRQVNSKLSSSSQKPWNRSPSRLQNST